MPKRSCAGTEIMAKPEMRIACIILLLFMVAPGLSGRTVDARGTTAADSFQLRNSRSPVVTIVYDNKPSRKGMETAWGFSCLVEGMEKTVLFDTGGDAKVLLSNMGRLGIVPREIDAVVVSHIHDDHTGGLYALLAENRQLFAYLPDSFPKSFFRDVKRSGATVIAVREPLKICDRVYSTGELGDSLREQSLVVATGRGGVVITGCAHPGIERIVRTVKERFGGEIFLVLGGFHLAAKGKREMDEVIAAMKALGVRYVAPCHCTGDAARKRLREAFGPCFIEAGAGKVIDPGRLQ